METTRKQSMISPFFYPVLQQPFLVHLVCWYICINRLLINPLRLRYTMLDQAHITTQNFMPNFGKALLVSEKKLLLVKGKWQPIFFSLPINIYLKFIWHRNSL